MYMLFIFFTFFSSAVKATTLDIIGPCASEPLLSLDVSSKFESVGDLTIHYFNKNRIPYLGNERAMNSIFNTVLGLDALEVVSDTQMRSYGWCFRVNGIVPDRFADEVLLKDGDHIEWFYAYAWYDKGWVSMCNPSYEVKSDWVCTKNK